MIRRDESPIELANRIVPLRTVLERTNIYVSEFTHGKSIKARCPYADIYHLNDDASKSMRVYSDSNTGYCYMGCGVLTPVSVYAKLNDLSYSIAAFRLLELIGHKLKSLDEKWQDAISEITELNREGYKAALLEMCSSHSAVWDELQYRTSISSNLSKMLDILDKATTEDQADRWLEVSSRVMKSEISKEMGNEVSERIS